MTPRRAAFLAYCVALLCAFATERPPSVAQAAPDPVPTVTAYPWIGQPYSYEGEQHAIKHATQIRDAAARRAADLRAAERRQARALPAGRPGRSDRDRAVVAVPADAWSRLIHCESGGNPRAVSPSGRYRGLLQFDLPTWRSVGFSGDPIDYPAHVQLEAGKRLHARRGFQPWPSCARRLGLIP
jgi:hypothetical protein